MSDFWTSLGETSKVVTSGWGAFAALGSFLIYLFGYLSLRFHLTSFGIETGLNLLDERYLFAGSRFLVYLVTSIPIVLLLVLLVAALVWPLVFLKRCVFPAAAPAAGATPADCWYAPLYAWWQRPLTPVLVGIVIAVALIQFVMRQCFVFSNLLVRDTLPGPPWLQTLLLTDNDGIRSLYFAGLLTGITLCSGLLLSAASRMGGSARSRFLTATLALLVGIQVLLLPVNHGVLIAGKSVPRVEFPDSEQQGLQPCSNTWYLWEGNGGVVLLCQAVEGTRPPWRMRVIGSNKPSSMEILGFDPILRQRFRP